MNIGSRLRRRNPEVGRQMRPLFGSLVLVLGALLLPALLYGIVAWRDRISVLEQAEQEIRDTTGILAEHAENVFETHKLIATVVNEHIRGMSWPEIAASKEVHEFLVDIILDQPRISSLWLIDPTGIIHNSSAVFPAPAENVADREYFDTLRQRDTGIFIGRVVHGRILPEDVFNVSARRSSSSGAFDGVISVSALPSYLTKFWSTVASDPGNAILVRRDGTIVARLPAADPGTPPLAPDDPLMQRIAEGNGAGFYRTISRTDGRERLFAYRKIGDFPVYVSSGINLDAALQMWYDHLVFYGGFFLAGTTGLVWLALVASHRHRRWRQAALELRQEIKHREDVETQFWQAQKMEALGRLASENAHDFGNILSVISGSLEMLETRPGDARILALARDATDRGARMVGVMLTFARQQPLRQEMIELNAALVASDGLLRQAAGSRIRLKIQPTAAPCQIAADRNQMELAILNIVINARDAMPDGGTLTITTKAVHLTGDPDGLLGDYAAIAIGDTGSGMSPDVRARVFEPFFTTKAPGSGTGLGLSMVYGFCKQSGGTVIIESVVGEGTTITVYLPISQSGYDNVALSKSGTWAST